MSELDYELILKILLKLSKLNASICFRYVEEGSTVSVMGVVRCHDYVLMIVPPQEPVSTGCRWWQCLFPTYVEGLVLTCDDNQDTDVVPV